MNSVLSIRPSKIGTPICMHLLMTSRRCMPASRASSVGVRWIAIRSPPAFACSCPLVLPERVDGANLFFAICGFPDARARSALQRPCDLLGHTFARTDGSVHVSGPVVSSLGAGPVDEARGRPDEGS